MDKYIYSLRELPGEAFLPAGGKAHSLAFMLQNTKLPIPEGYVILCDAFKFHKETDPENSESPSPSEKARPVPALTKEATAELTALLKKLDPKVTYAVRSSAVSEDGERASFAGQYETLTDVRLEDIPKAVETVARSSENETVTAYRMQNPGSEKVEAEPLPRNHSGSDIAVVIQRFVKAEFAGVLFTADPVTGRDDFMVGNYVHGAGEALVSGAKNAEVFRLNSVPVSKKMTSNTDGAISSGQKSDIIRTAVYEGPAEFARYAKRLRKYARVIRTLYGRHMDIEWAVAGRKLWILQARPITTLTRLTMDTYEVNGSSGSKLLTKTNVGEIFMQPVSPMTFSVLEKINGLLGLPDWLDNIYGQPYMNISVMVSLAVAFGAKKEKAYEVLKGLVGNVPEGIEVPISPFDRKAFLKAVFKLFFPKERSKLSKAEKKQMVGDLVNLSRNFIEQIRNLRTEQELLEIWSREMLPAVKDGLASIMGQSGTSMVPLFRTRSEIAKVAGEEMADRLCSGCLGGVESMKPLLLLEEVRNGKLSKEEYLDACGQRCPNEMELMAPHPYEDPSYVDRLLRESEASGVDLGAMLSSQKNMYEEALQEFKKKYPKKSKWIEKKIDKFVQANAFREDLRGKGVWIFCVFREYLLAAGRITRLGEDVFLFTFDEVFEYLKGDHALAETLPARRRTYERYLQYEAFPNLVVGRFDPDKWMADPGRRRDIFPAMDGSKGMTEASGKTGAEERNGSAEKSGTMTGTDSASAPAIKGFPGAAGVVRGRVRVVLDVSAIGEICEGEILVTAATNVGWTPVFPKVAAIITDIGAPLSHAAIIARECGIPAVVGCGNATTFLHTGDEVIVDGSAGTVTMIH